MTFRSLTSGTLLATVFAGLLCAGCSGPESHQRSSQQDTLSMAGKSDKIIIYQIMTRLFGNTKTTNKKYGTIEENGVGKFADISTKALKELKKLGTTHVWYTGVLEHATMTDYTSIGIPLDDIDVVKGRAGSPYAIKDYYDICPDLAENPQNRKQEFAALLERTHKEGLKALIDFVPNHVARGYLSDAAPEGTPGFGADDDVSVAFKPSNNFYYIPGKPFDIPKDYDPLPGQDHPTKDHFFMESPAKATGNDVFSSTPSVNDWFETAKLNYGVDYLNFRERHFDPVPDTWTKMYDILAYWTRQGVDGFRCDMAEMVPVEFWEWVIPRIQAINPDIIFIAEIYNPNEYRNYIEKGHFDYLYDKVELYDTLRHIVEGKANTDHITTVWQRQEGIASHMLRFLENHDEQRIASPYFAGNPTFAIPAMVLIATMHTGPVMVYFGQEVGEPATGSEGFSGEDGRTTIFDYWGVPNHQKWVNSGKFDGAGLSGEEKELQAFYRFILTFATKEPAIASGGFYDLHYFNRSHDYTGHSNNVFTFLRHDSESAFLIAVNFNKSDSEQVSLKIPEDALNILHLDGKRTISFTNYQDKADKFAVNTSDLTAKSSPEALSFTLAPNSFKIYRVGTKK